MPNLEVIQIVASCVRAFHNGADRLELLQARDARNDANQRSLTMHEKALADMLQKLLKDGGDAISTHFQEAQIPLGPYAAALLQGDDRSKVELLGVALQLQEDVGEKLSAAAINGDAQAALDGLQALYATAMAKQMEAKQSITQLQQRIIEQISQNTHSNSFPSHRNSVETMARDFRNDAVAFTRDGAQYSPQAGPSSHQQRLLANMEGQQHLIPDIRADDIQSLAVTDWDQDDRFTMAPEGPQNSSSQQESMLSFHRYVGQQGMDQRFMDSRYMDPSSAASFRAAFAPEAIERRFRPEVPIEAAGPYFPPTSRPKPREDHDIPVLRTNRRDRPSLTESANAAQRTDSMPWTQRMLTPSSIATGSSSPRISEPDSAISLRHHTPKPYCTGAWNAQEDLIAGFARDFLPTLPGSSKRELCWKCKECDFNQCDSEGQLLEAISFEEGVRYRFTFLARAHVAYKHPENALRPSYQYGCTFCTAEGKRSGTYSTTQTLMSHIHAKHRTNLTPEVRERVRCIVGRSASREEQWDCNLADIGSQGGALKRFMVGAVTGLRT